MQQIHSPPNPSVHLSKLVTFNQKRILYDSQFRPTVLNVKLASNPFLKDQQKFHFLIYKLNDYNKRVLNSEVTDPFEAMCYERLHSIVCDLPYIDTKQNQILRLEESLLWYKEQEKMIMQRKDQGEVRYEVTKQSRNGFQIEKEPPAVSQVVGDDDIPAKKIAKQTLPYKKGWRTMHKEIDIPARRLSEYKRKILNIAPFIQPKEQIKAPRILYPKMPRFDPKVDEPQQPPEEQNKEGQVGADGEVPPKEGEQPPPGQQQAPQEPEQQDLGGFGEEPGQPEEEEPPADDEDKLAPRLKSYVLEKEDIIRMNEMKSGYQHYRGQQCETQRRMEERYLKIYQNTLKQQKEESMMIQIADEWGRSKGKIQKQRQKRLQNAKFSSKYSFSAEEPPKIEMLSPQEQIKFGFATMNLRNKPRHSEINLSGGYLPKIGQQNLYEKSIRNDRLKSLKSKYQKLLNLQEFEQRETAPSICQYSSRKRGLSEVIRNHSKSKERLHQLDEVIRIKQKLARGKVGVDIKSLSMGLCLPEDQVAVLKNEQNGEIIFPDKILPSNPFMVETKKKKKKKK